jgi:prepilin-type processing-associated H-X9-DG protein
LVSATRRAFTLAELLVTILIVMILLALLIPTLQAALQTAYLTQCKGNLATIYKAQVECQQDHEAAMFVAKGNGWNCLLLPYLENRLEVFRCPACLGRIEDSGSSTTSIVTSPGTGPAPGMPASSGAAPPQPPGFDISFNIFSDPTFRTFDWNVSLNSPWCRTQHPPSSQGASTIQFPDGRSITVPWGSMDQAGGLNGLGDGGGSVANNCWRYEIENRGFLVEETGNWAWADDYADIDIVVYYEGGRPAQIKIIQHKMGSQARRSDLLINGQLVVHNIDAPENIGRIIDLRPAGSSVAGGNGGSESAGGSGASTTIIETKFTYVPCDYGMSRGVYDVPGVDVSRVDGKLFFILDYPKRLADYTTGGADRFEWDSYFFVRPEGWTPPRSGAPVDASWVQYQALRHFGKANVLFMDGHIETLPAVGTSTSTVYSTEDVNNGRCLAPESAYWEYGRPRPY